MNAIKLEQHLKKFFRSGFKRHYFTNEIYTAMHVYTGCFIAHFDKDGFYKERFQQPNGFFETIGQMRQFREKYSHKAKDSAKARALLGAYTRDYLKRMEIVDKFLQEQVS